MRTPRKLEVGDWVEVKSKEAILATLDAKGQLDGMPFMPEMFRFCGQRFQVYKRAHKTCDTVFPVRGRRVDQAVHLNTRCDGSAHGGCQAGCLIFWKEAWLKPVNGKLGENLSVTPNGTKPNSQQCTESQVMEATQHSDAEGVPVYSCQATRLPYFTGNLNWWDIEAHPGRFGIFIVLQFEPVRHWNRCAHAMALRQACAAVDKNSVSETCRPNPCRTLDSHRNP
jgi:hypothetical protein